MDRPRRQQSISALAPPLRPHIHDLLIGGSRRRVHSDPSATAPMSALDPKRTSVDAKSRGLKLPPAVPMAPAVTPAVTAPVTAPATVHASPAVTPAVSPPLHVCQIIEARGGSRRKREDRCRLGRSGPARKNQTCNSDRKYCAQHMCLPIFHG
jgi:hypothetical protein